MGTNYLTSQKRRLRDRPVCRTSGDFFSLLDNLDCYKNKKLNSRSTEPLYMPGPNPTEPV